MNEPLSQSTNLSFFTEGPAGTLFAQYDPAAAGPAPDMASLESALQASEYADFYRDSTALLAFIKLCRDVKELQKIQIGERRDAEFSLEVSDDLLSAYLTLIPAQGGKAIGSAINDALREQGIIHGILHKELDAALAAGACHHVLIAEGEPPRQGVAGKLEPLFGAQKSEIAQRDELAIIKFRELSHLLIVHVGDELMRRTPPVQGKFGMNIKGQVILAKPMPEMAFAAQLQGAVPSAANPDLLVATNAGQPVVVDNGVIVNPVLQVPDVDLSTGNISFEGTIHVDGDIKAGMILNVTGDIIVNGLVEAADITAGGNVAVTGGIIGLAEKKPGTQHLSGTTSRIKCAGSVQALFAENAHIEAGDSIHLQQNARQCELVARREIIVGKPGSNVGNILGGRAQAALAICAVSIGSPVATRTQIQVGFDPYRDQQVHDKQYQIGRKASELDQLIKLQAFFATHPQKAAGGVGEKVEAKRMYLLAELDTLEEELDELEAEQELIDKASVKIIKKIHEGVEIQIGKQKWQVKEDSGPGNYQLHDGHIAII
ncbi:DUF342 domain-containing protein [Undibacterium sp.]|uniref:DUF342 domain-containing protein n=1 Tax=Undibacterium sp. TaxID=1914977 RepID=UPI002731CC2C|nr:FapA family protein [Undibacterium sp.]MDP1976797.1 FapA family protein [Undibacterium sp.]